MVYEKEKIVLIANTSWNLYNFRLPLIKQLNKKFNLFLLSSKDNYLKFIPKKIKKFSFTFKPSGINIFFEIISVYQIYNILKKIKPKTVISFTPKINLYVTIISIILKYKHLSVFTGLGNLFIKKNYFNFFIIFIFKFFFKKNNYIIFQNINDLNLFVKNKIAKKNKLKLINGSGVSLKNFPFTCEKNNKIKKFLYIGRIIEDKGILDLLKAISFLKNKYNFQFTFVGDIDSKRILPKTNSYFQKLKEKQYFEHIPHTLKPYNYIKKTNFLVLPSLREGLPRSILEAFAVGRVVIASNVPGCTSLIKHKNNGLLFKVKNYKSLAITMIDAMKLSRNNVNRIVKKNLKDVQKKYQDKIIIKKYLQLIK